MNQEDLFKKIGSILNELQDQYEYLAQNSKQINELELELFFANASFLTDHVQILQKVNNSKPLVSIPEHTEVNPDEIPEKVSPPASFAEPVVPPLMSPHANPVAEPKTELAAADVAAEKIEPASAVPVIDSTPEMEKEIFKLDNQPASFEFILSDKPSTDKFEFEEKPVTAIFDRPLSAEEQRIVEEKQKLQAYKERDLFAEEELEDEDTLENEVLEEEAIPSADDEVGPEPFLVFKDIPPIPEVKEPGSQSTATLESAPPALSKPTLNDMLAGSMGLHKNVNPENRKPAISDLKQAITLNQKLLFIKDLFNGYNLAYAEAIDLLNRMTDFKTADAFLQKNYAVKNDWASRKATADQFYELLHQRFPEGD